MSLHSPSHRDPHVGVAECMKAFVKVPDAQKQRLERFLDGQTRFIGGSADTMYIPGRHRESFMDTLGLFLETQCFLEIATPTTLHLVVPQDEPILFVDHVRPFVNYSFGFMVSTDVFMHLHPRPNRNGAVVDMGTTTERDVREEQVGCWLRGRHLPYVPLGRRRR